MATAAKSLEGRRRPSKTLPVVAIAAKPVVALSALAGGVSRSQHAASRLSIYRQRIDCNPTKELVHFSKGEEVIECDRLIDVCERL